MAAPALERFVVGDLTGTVCRGTGNGTLLMVHGMFGGAWNFEHYQRFFAERGWDAYALNLRGHHGSRPVEHYGRVSVMDYVADATEVAEWLARDGTAPVVIGHSMGGLISQKIAEAGLARALALIASAPPRGIIVQTPRLIVKQFKYLPELLLGRPIVSTFQDQLDLTFNCTPPEEQRADHARLIPESGRAGLQMSLGVVKVSARKVTCPVLVVQGTEDRFIVPRIGRSLSRKYVAPIRELPTHGHWIIHERGWEDSAAVVLEWLESLEPAPVTASSPT